MDTLDDLLIRRRRGGLREAEERRLRSGLRASPEHELSLLAGDVFERDGAPLPGDEERLGRIVAGALPRSSGASRSWPRPRVPLWAAVPVLLAAAAAASVGGYRALSAGRTPPTTPVELAPQGPASASARERPTSPASASSSAHAEPAAPAPEPRAAAALEPTASDGAPTIAAAAPLESSRRRPRRAAVRERPLARAGRLDENASASRATSVTSEQVGAAGDVPPLAAGAAELFQRANAARRTDWSAAAALYAELVERYPRSTEAGVAEVALGKWSLALGRGGDALEWFRVHQRRGAGPLAAEALWGEARALESIGSHAAARGAWQRLLDVYPGSPYARVARERLAR